MAASQGLVQVVKAKAEFTNETILFALRKKEPSAKRQTIVRSYESFVQLRSALVRAHPDIFVPSIPDAPYPQLLSDAEHVEKKRRRLNKFLLRTSVIPELANDTVFIRFCTVGPFIADDERPKSPTLGGEVSRLTGFFKGLYNGITGRTSLATVTSMLTMSQGVYADIPVLDPDLIATTEEFQQVRDAVLRLGHESSAIIDAISKLDVASRGKLRTN